MAFLLMALMLTPAVSEAQDTKSFKTSADIDAEVAPRLSHSEAVASMTTRAGSVDLLLSEESILIQFTDDYLDKIASEIKSKSDEHSDTGSILANVITSAVSSGVRTLLDNAIALPLHQISNIHYSDGRVIILSLDGDEIFKDLEIDDKSVMEDFSRRDARRFIAEAEKRVL